MLRRAAEPDGPAIALAADPAAANLPEPVALALFRVAQEALRNAVRHAGARRIAVT